MFTVKTSAKETAIAVSIARYTRYASACLKSILLSQNGRRAQKRPNVPDRLIRREEADSVHPQSLGAGDVLRHIVDEDSFAGGNSEAVESQLVDSRIGLDQAHFGGDHDVIKGIGYVPFVFQVVPDIGHAFVIIPVLTAGRRLRMKST